MAECNTDLEEPEAAAQEVELHHHVQQEGQPQPQRLEDIDFEYEDHFSLKHPSALVRFREKHVRIYDLANDQLQLEHRLIPSTNANSGEDDEKQAKKQKMQLQVTMKRMRGGSLGLRFLRTLYTLAALLMFGFLFVFTTQMVGYQIMEIPQHTKQGTGIRIEIGHIITAIVTLPLLVYSMASLMVYGMVFISDTWNGHVLFGLLLAGLHRNGHWGDRRVLIEWYFFGMFLAIPILFAAICFYAKIDNATNISLLFWYACINVTFFIFCAVAAFHEVKLCLDLTKIIHRESGLLARLQKALLITLTQQYAGTQQQTHVVDDQNSSFDPKKSIKPPTKTTMGLYSRFTLLCGCLFTPLDPPQRNYSVEEIQETVPYITNNAWSLEKMCCRLRNGRTRLVVGGPNAIESAQYQSTLACSVAGVVLLVMFATGFLTNMGQSILIVVVGGVVIATCCGLPCILSAVQLYKSQPSTDDDEDDDDDDGDNEDDGDALLFQAWANYTVSKPKEWFCWLRLILSFGVLYVWPVVGKYVQGLPKNATFLLVVGIISGARLYLDAGSILQEAGTMSQVDFFKNTISDSDNDNNHGSAQTEKQEKAATLIARARASETMGKVTSSSRLWLWVLLYTGVSAYFFYSLSSYGREDRGINPLPNAGRPPIRILDDFYYEPQKDISYPMCTLEKGFKIPGRNVTHMTDYNMIAAMAYEITSVTDYILDKWFQEEDFFIDETPLVAKWRKDSGNEFAQVSFKLFSIPSQPGFGIVSIRGTETPTDNMLNMQLYMSSMLTQIVQLLVPYCWIFGPIIPDLVSITSWIGSEQLQNANYYSIVVDFVNDLVDGRWEYQGRTFDTLRITGVSLGGGLAMIAGAQSGAYAVGFAGPNPTLARNTFIPPIPLEDINERVINVVPDGDFAANIGGEVRNKQSITCRDWPAEYNKCHSFWKQMCEFMYSCGSDKVVCTCVERFSYPEPKTNGNRTFVQACQEEEELLKPHMNATA